MADTTIPFPNQFPPELTSRELWEKVAAADVLLREVEDLLRMNGVDEARFQRCGDLAITVMHPRVEPKLCSAIGVLTRDEQEDLGTTATLGWFFYREGTTQLLQVFDDAKDACEALIILLAVQDRMEK